MPTDAQHLFLTPPATWMRDQMDAGRSSAHALLTGEQHLLVGQGAYYALTGAWALVSLRTFEMVTGPKTDGWLVKTVGVLVGVIGGVLGLAARRGEASPEVALLAMGSALGLTGIDVTYIARRRISPIYLADAAVELALVAVWLRQRSLSSLFSSALRTA